MRKLGLPRRQVLTYLGLGGLGVGTALTIPHLRSESRSALQSPAPVKETPAAAPSLPEFQGITNWLNSSPLTVADLQGSIVLIQFWTFACINCQRTLPYVVDWHQKYASQGLKIVGIHTPEFAYERQVENVRAAIAQHQIAYPVPMDNGFETWRAYNNEYWPHLFLADRQGIIQYDHIGEGAYDTTEQKIRQLLG
jgi:thiol-disulfide isomerase/thioredoxin